MLAAEHASLPPRGWNSYDSFCWTISEEEFLQSAEIISKQLLPHGYEYVVVDYLWYRRKLPGAYTDSLGFDVIDKWGRMIPDPDRWPSSKGGKGFTEVVKKGGAYEESGRKWTAKDIGIKERAYTKLGAGRAFFRSLYEQHAEWGVDFVKHDCVFGDDLDVNEISYVSEVLKELDRPILYSLSPGTSVTPAMAKVVSGLVNMYRTTGDDWDTWADVAAHFDVTRDFSTANMVGAEGLLGRSWPDLDMLPLGLLTDPGSNEGPHRTCNLNLYEQRTQMTLWSMAKSPLMFGGDFLHITSTKKSKKGDEIIYWQSRKCLTDKTSEAQVLGLTGCADMKAVGWSSEALEQDPEQICWKQNLGSKHQTPFCPYKRESMLTSDEDITDKQQYQGKLQLLATDRPDFCLHASPKRKVTSKEHKRVDLQSLIIHAAKVNSGGVRSWIATGRKGEVYVAFFNLNPVTTVISAKISDLAKALPSANLNETSCKYREVWNGKDYGVVNQSISIVVETHGTASF
ncbi:Glycoside hydrolase [Trema orientale]|uniref:Alpha-galactosidase n=1 Tax=Trema orientale TaxID=63057 RepID=A0A2P5FMR2_TREOI|nr:Glycoside hydrolase [Trema orientale]